MTDSIRFCFILVSTFLLLSIAVHVTLAANYVPTDVILLNCGGPGNLTDANGRKWGTDIGSKFLLSSKSSTSDAADQKPSVPQVPFMTARVFQSEFTYSFPVTSGRKFVRLYFYPSSYNKLNATNAIFSVTVGSYTLLRNFSAAQTTEALNFDYLTKEFSIHVPSETLNMTFSPSPNTSNSFAFINGIEIISHPDIYNTADGTTFIVGQVDLQHLLIIDGFTALENVYRLNVGGKVISPSGDTGMFRSWSDDSQYIFSAANGVAYTADDENVTVSYPRGAESDVAPLDIYKTARSMGPSAKINEQYNLTWVFSVDSGFNYLVRLHFCEITKNITKINQRVFVIDMNNQTAEPEADVIAWAGSKGVPFHKDYGVSVPSGAPQQDLWLALHPNIAYKSKYHDAVLNGVEIFKVNDTNGNLAGLNPIPVAEPHHFVPGGAGVGIAAVILIGLVVCLVTRRGIGLKV